MQFVENRELKESCDYTDRLGNGVFARYDGGANEHYRRRGEYGRSSRTARIDHRFVPSSRIVHANHIKGGPTSPNRRSRAWGRAHAPRDASDDLIGHFAAASTIAGRFAKDPGRHRRPSATTSLTPARIGCALARPIGSPRSILGNARGAKRAPGASQPARI
jgi:hypothetical protein